MSSQLPDEANPIEGMTDPDSERTLGLSGLSDFPAQASGYPNHTYAGGGILYPASDISRAQALALAPCENYFAEQAPWKVAEEWQAADISYAVEYANQDYRRMNEAQHNANAYRTKAPKASSRPSTSEIIGNLSGSPANSILSDDASILALLGY